MRGSLFGLFFGSFFDLFAARNENDYRGCTALWQQQAEGGRQFATIAFVRDHLNGGKKGYRGSNLQIGAWMELLTWRRLSKLTKSLEQFHCGVIVQSVAVEIAPIQTLEVRRKRYVLLYKEDDFLSVECHRSANFNQHIIVDFGVFVTVSIKILPLRAYVNDPGRAGSHILKYFLRNWNRR